MQRTTTIAITIAMRIRWCILPTRTTWLPVCVCLWLSYVGMMNPNEMVNPRMPQAAAQGYPYASTFAPAPMSPFEQSVWLSTSLWLLCRSRTFLFLRRKIWWRWMRLSARTSSELISTPASTLLLLSRSLRLRAWCLNCLLRSFILTFLFQRCLKRESRMPSMYFVSLAALGYRFWLKRARVLKTSWMNTICWLLCYKFVFGSIDKICSSSWLFFCLVLWMMKERKNGKKGWKGGLNGKKKQNW